MVLTLVASACPTDDDRGHSGGADISGFQDSEVTDSAESSTDVDVPTDTVVTTDSSATDAGHEDLEVGSGIDVDGTDVVDDTPSDIVSTDSGADDAALDQDSADATTTDSALDLTDADVPDVVVDTSADLDHGSCPDGTSQALIVRETGVFCMDKWEVARPDASNFSGGTQDPDEDNLPRVQAGLIPWAGATLEEATASCALLDRRICSAAEWYTACAGSQERELPYTDALDDYVGNFCNGYDRGQGAAFPVQGHPNCITPDGVYDLSGNLAEWADDGLLHGGSFEDPKAGLSCSPGRDSNAEMMPMPDEGFRCCSDPV